MTDQLVDGRRFSILTIVDNFTRENLALHTAQHIKKDDVVDILEKLAADRGKLARWRDGYNRHRPHSSLEDLSPMEFLVN